MERIAIIGGGAAGFFCASVIAERQKECQIQLFEKTNKKLTKVKISGGGRCNVTNGNQQLSRLIKGYPRGKNFLKKAFHQFASKEAYEWFEQRGVELKVEEDGRVFPVSNQSQEIVDCLSNVLHDSRVKLISGTGNITIEKKATHWSLETKEGQFYEADKLVVATGSDKTMWDTLALLGHTIVAPVPSLFTFKIKDKRLEELQGVSLPLVQLKLPGTKAVEEAPFLITHWGISGPVTLRVSAWQARELHQQQYQFSILLNFVPQLKEEEVRSVLQEMQRGNKKEVQNHTQFGVPKRLWQSLCIYIDITNERFIDLSKKQINRLVTELTQGHYQVNGKATFKDEFVTAGGVELKEIEVQTLESKLHSNLYFAGEVLDIDAITGGYNFQAAWTTAWIVGKHV